MLGSHIKFSLMIILLVINSIQASHHIYKKGIDSCMDMYVDECYVPCSDNPAPNAPSSTYCQVQCYLNEICNSWTYEKTTQMCDQITCPISDWISTCKVKGAPANVDLTYCLQIEDNCDAFKYSKCDIDETHLIRTFQFIDLENCQEICQSYAGCLYFIVSFGPTCSIYSAKPYSNSDCNVVVGPKEPEYEECLDPTTTTTIPTPTTSPTTTPATTTTTSPTTTPATTPTTTTITTTTTSTTTTTTTTIATTTISTTTTTTSTTNSPPTTTTRLLVVTGEFSNQDYNDRFKSEIIDLENEDIVCDDFMNAPYSMRLGTGGFANGHPIICGGYDGVKQLNDCFALEPNGIGYTHMEYARNIAASIAYNNKLWVTGGFGDGNTDWEGTFTSSELVDGLIVTKGPELPWKFYRHCATQINSTHGILIGGQGRLKGSLIVDLNNNFQMSTGPDLTGIGRRDHMCTKFSYMNGNYVLVAGGKDLENTPNLTTEILNVNDIGRGWTPGPEIPIECVDGSMVTSPNGEGAIMLGCSTNPEKIYIMKWNGHSLQWTLMKQTLKYPKYYTVAMLIPKELTSCIL